MESLLKSPPSGMLVIMGRMIKNLSLEEFLIKLSDPTNQFTVTIGHYSPLYCCEVLETKFKGVKFLQEELTLCSNIIPEEDNIKWAEIDYYFEKNGLKPSRDSDLKYLPPGILDIVKDIIEDLSVNEFLSKLSDPTNQFTVTISPNFRFYYGEYLERIFKGVTFTQPEVTLPMYFSDEDEKKAYKMNDYLKKIGVGFTYKRKRPGWGGCDGT